VFVDRARRLSRKGRETVVVLATDYEPAVSAFRAAFGPALLVQPGVVRANSALDDQAHHGHRYAELALGEQALVDCLMLSRCDAMLHVTSNLATAAAYINPRLRLIYCETWGQAVRGYVWSLWRWLRWRASPLRVGFRRLVRRLRDR
jgi:hypothetical protein